MRQVMRVEPGRGTSVLCVKALKGLLAGSRVESRDGILNIGS